MRIIRGTQDAKGVIYQKQPDGGTGRMRCMKCTSLVVQATLHDGKQVMQCTGCGANHTVSSMDKPPGRPHGALPTKPPR
jgi:hypothetical protein